MEIRIFELVMSKYNRLIDSITPNKHPVIIIIIRLIDTITEIMK
jgi:hypothetical protein